MIDRIHGGNCLRQNIIDFSVNVNPLGLPKGLSDIISRNTHRILQYPDPSSQRLKRRLAAFHSVGRDNVAIGNGLIELIHLVPRIFKAKFATIITPTFSEYEFAIKANRLRPVFLNTDERESFKIESSKVIKSLMSSSILFLCNPNNPTGFLLDDDKVLYLARFCKKCGAAIIVDEAFIEFAKGSNRTIIITESLKNRSLVILRSLTKFFAIPGLRLGYAIGHKKTIEHIVRLQYPWNVNSLAQLAGEKVLEEKSYMDRTRQFIAKERQYVFEKLSDIKGLKIYPSSTNFILCKLQNAKVQNSKELTKRLLGEDIYIRDCGNFRGLDDRFFRVAVRKRDDNNRLINSVEEALR